MSSHKVIVAGVPTSGGGIGREPPSRREIYDLVKDEKQFSLYVQALQAISSEKEGDVLSLFAVGGIHGRPFVTWDSANITAEDGYCTHGSTLFPTWHRPYVLLLQQALQGAAEVIAKKYDTEQEAWKNAAANLRSPYWDWARTGLPPSQVYKDKEIQIITPTSKGKPVTVPNPILGYRFQDKLPLSYFEPPYSNWQTTLRHPVNNASNINAFETSLLGFQGRTFDVRRRNTRTMLRNTLSWSTFSNHGYIPGSGGSANSLEAVHDEVHGAIGGQGHMGDPGYAAFDPIFWMHHTNVDRLLAFWQSLHPNLWVTPAPDPGTATIPEGSTTNVNSNLTPFWNGATTFHQSSTAGVRDWTKLNYTYPEYQGLHGLPENKIHDAISDIVNQLYSGTASPVKQLSSFVANAPTISAAVAPAAVSLPAADSGAVRVAASSGPTGSGHGDDAHPRLLEWFVRIRSKKYALGASYSVLLFLGPPPEDQAEWRGSPNFVGLHFYFVNSSQEHCANCASQSDLIDEGFVTITHALEIRGHESRSEAEIEEYLKANLQWRVQKIDAEVVDPNNVEGLEIAVMTIPIKFSPSHHTYLSEENARPRHRHLTDNRAGGRHQRQ